MCRSKGGSMTLWQLFKLFLKIGSTGFGGFMALIAQVQSYAVERRKLLSQDDMLDGISLATILPGPVAVNTVAYTGYRIRGWAGAAVAATAVMMPSFLLMLLLTDAYFRWGSVPAVGKLFNGFIPAVAAVVLAAAWNMARKTTRTLPEGLIAAASCLCLIMVRGFFTTVGIIGVSAVLGWLLFRQGTAPGEQAATASVAGDRTARNGIRLNALSPALSMPLMGTNIAVAGKLFATFGSMSLLLFGGGYVFIPLMQQVVVDGYGWVTRKEFLDGIALGQIMPGPILISSVFIGYKVAGLLGAVAATAGMFGPPAVVMLLCTRFLDRIKQSVPVLAALRGIRSGVLGMITAAVVVIARTAQPNLVSIAIFAAALVALLKFKVETAWVIPIAGVAGVLFY